MSKFIKVDEIKQKIKELNFDIGDYYLDEVIAKALFNKAIANCKQYELEPPKKAKWLETRDNNKKRCSNCDFIFMIATYPACSADFRPHCGAKMDIRLKEKNNACSSNTL